MLRTLLLSAVAAHAFAAAAPAQPPAQVRGEAVVRYDDLDLSRETDARQMLVRLDKAAVNACGGYPFRGTVAPGLTTFVSADFRECRDSALANAVAALKTPLVSRLYAQSTAQRPNRIANR